MVHRHISECRAGTRYARHEDQEKEAPDHSSFPGEFVSHQKLRSDTDTINDCSEWKASCKIHPQTGKARTVLSVDYVVFGSKWDRRHVKSFSTCSCSAAVRTRSSSACVWDLQWDGRIVSLQFEAVHQTGSFSRRRWRSACWRRMADPQ